MTPSEAVVTFRADVTPAAVAVGDGAVWVLPNDDVTVSKIDPRTNSYRVLQTIATAAVPTSSGLI